ncbi:hypothetical protein QBC44DRAFT_254240, partial [Cladorrhinum sp. PSN332]
RISRANILEYPIALLRNTIALTSELKHNYPYVKYRLIYVQIYSLFKELLNAKGTYPFSNPGIANLGYSVAN